LQQPAIKLPAPLRTVGINPAQLAVEAGTRLREGEFAFPLFLQAETQANQLFRVIASAQFHIRKQRAVATKSASRTERGDGSGISHDGDA